MYSEEEKKRIYQKLFNERIKKKEFKEMIKRLFMDQLSKDLNIVKDYGILFGTIELDEALDKKMSIDDMEKRINKEM